MSENKNQNNFEYVSSYSEEYAAKVLEEIEREKKAKKAKSAQSFKSFWLGNNKRNIKRAVALFAAFLVIFSSTVFVYVKLKLDQITYDPGSFTYSGEPTEENFEDEQFDAMHDIHDASSLDDLLYQWYNTGSDNIMSQDYILNVLMLGVDSKDGKMVDGRSDAIILVSLNKKLKKITLVSFLRDSRTYMEASGSRTTKINEAYFYGGPYAVMQCIENDYKVKIDNYIAVDFYSFPKLIDALGGLTVEVQEYEAKFINRTTKYTIDYGPEVTLSGNESLVFSRIRYSDADADISRTRRHRQVIASLIKSASSASAGQLNNAMNLTLPYVSTDMSKTKIVSLATQALTQHWMDYEMVQLRMPAPDAAFKDATLNRTFFWVIDYPLAARELQTALYGTTNIQLDADRVSALDFISVNNSYSQPSSTSSHSVEQTEPPTQETTTRYSSILGGLLGGLGGNKQTTAAPATDAEPTQEPETAAPEPDTTSEPEVTAAPPEVPPNDDTPTLNDGWDFEIGG